MVVQGVDSRETQYAIVTFDDDGVDVELRDLNGIKGDTSTSAPFGTPAVMVLGARYNQGAVFNFGAVDLYEVGLYTRELSPAERDQIESYLQRRHGLRWNPQFLGKDLAWFHDADASGFTLERQPGRAVERSERQQPSLDANQRGQADPHRRRASAVRSSSSTASTTFWSSPGRHPRWSRSR